MCPLCKNQTWRIFAATPEWQIRRCESCTNAWTHPPPGQYDYENHDFHSETTEGSVLESCGIEKLPLQWQRCIHQQVCQLERVIPPGSKILEVGCGEGLLLNELAKVGFSVYGIEPSKTASERARRQGLKVITGHFPSEALTGPFDIVILSHVLEHLSDPGKIIEQIKAAAPGGYLFLVQSHYKGLIPTLEREKWYAWMPTQHFWHFTPKGLELVCGSYGFGLVDYEFSSLVHPNKWWWIRPLALLCPRLYDQFHILLQIPSTKSQIAAKT
jgi:SAM-dependent methyltransferase